MIVFTLVCTYLLVLVVYLYRIFIRPIASTTCSMQPSCSEYGLIAIKKYGAWKGGYLAIKRIISCHPWQKKLIDPVL